jgi:peptidoglycan hydrolase CwlO-like protein
METIDILTTIGGIMMAIIGYFLKTTMEDLKRVKEVTYETKNKVAVIENDYINKIDALNDKFDLLATNLKELNQSIKELNNKIK